MFMKFGRTLSYYEMKVKFEFENNCIDRTQTASKKIFDEDRGRHRDNLDLITE